MTIAGEMVAVVEAVWPVPSVAVAITVQEREHDGVESQVVHPPFEIDPQEAAKVALLVAVNCWVEPVTRLGLSGEIVNGTGGPTLSVP